MKLPLSSGLRPEISPDTEPFWEGLREGEVRAQRCTACGRYRFPPMPQCPWCGEAGARWSKLTSTPRLYSWITVYKAVSPDIPVPYTVALAEFDEGVRIPGNLVGHEGMTLRAGLPLNVSFAGGDDVRIVVYRPANASDSER